MSAQQQPPEPRWLGVGAGGGHAPPMNDDRQLLLLKANASPPSYRKEVKGNWLPRPAVRETPRDLGRTILLAYGTSFTRQNRVSWS